MSERDTWVRKLPKGLTLHEHIENYLAGLPQMAASFDETASDPEMSTEIRISCAAVSQTLTAVGIDLRAVVDTAILGDLE